MDVMVALGEGESWGVGEGVDGVEVCAFGEESAGVLYAWCVPVEVAGPGFDDEAFRQAGWFWLWQCDSEGCLALETEAKEQD